MLPALFVGLVTGMAGLLFADWRTAVLLGGVATLSTVLLPGERTQQPPADGATPT